LTLISTNDKAKAVSIAKINTSIANLDNKAGVQREKEIDGVAG
jgi:hypothetical protein